MLDEGVDPPVPFEQQAKSGRRAAVIGSGPAGMAAAYYLLIAGHDVTVFERDPAPGGMLRYGIPQYRLPKVEVLEAEYESVTRLGGKMVVNAGLGRDFTLDDLTLQGFDSVVVAIGCYDTNKLGIPNEDADGVIDGLEYLRTATLGLPYPDHAGKRVVVIGGGFTSMDCSRTSVRQGAGEVTLVYRRDMKDMPAADEVHEAIEEGVTAIFQAGPIAGHHRRDDQARSPASSSSGCSSASPTRPAGAARSPRPAPSSPSRATGCCWPSARAPSSTGWRSPATKAPRPRSRSRLKADVGHVRDRPARACSAPATCGSARRPWSRPSPRAGARRTPSMPSSRAWTSTPSGPARRSPSRSPSSCRSCRSRPRSRSRATG